MKCNDRLDSLRLGGYRLRVDGTVDLLAPLGKTALGEIQTRMARLAVQRITERE